MKKSTGNNRKKPVKAQRSKPQSRNNKWPALTYESLGSISFFLAGTFFGSALAYYFDPLSGRQRKALVRDKAVRLKHDSAWYGNKVWKNLRNRSQGLKARTLKKTEGEQFVNDEKLVQRVRSKFGRDVIHSKSIDVTAENGVITLSGPILAHEVDHLIKRVKKVEGVKDIINNLDVHETADGISGLQGEGPEYLQS